MDAKLLTRNVVIDGKRTTIRLESDIWDAVDDLCKREKISRHDLCSHVEAGRDGLNRAQAIRAVVVNYFRFALLGESGSISVFEQALGNAGAR